MSQSDDDGPVDSSSEGEQESEENARMASLTPAGRLFPTLLVSPVGFVVKKQEIFCKRLEQHFMKCCYKEKVSAPPIKRCVVINDPPAVRMVFHRDSGAYKGAYVGACTSYLFNVS